MVCFFSSVLGMFEMHLFPSVVQNICFAQHSIVIFPFIGTGRQLVPACPEAVPVL